MLDRRRRIDANDRSIGLSVEVESVATHLRGYGFDERGDGALVYRTAVPRFLDLFETLQVAATFFLVAEEAEHHPDIAREIVARGHEIASHTATHPRSLARCEGPALTDEIDGARARLEHLSATRVVGFRSSSRDTPPELLERLAAAGYRYDASRLPGRVGVPGWLGALGARRVPRRRDTMFRDDAPAWRRTQFGLIAEIPRATLPGLRLPWHHGRSFRLPGPVFAGLTEAMLLRSGGVHYGFHAVDLLGRAEDGVDERLGIHPGMDDSLEEKIERARSVLARLRLAGSCVPLRALLIEELGADPRGTFSARRRGAVGTGGAPSPLTFPTRRRRRGDATRALPEGGAD